MLPMGTENSGDHKDGARMTSPLVLKAGREPLSVSLQNPTSITTSFPKTKLSL